MYAPRCLHRCDSAMNIRSNSRHAFALTVTVLRPAVFGCFGAVTVPRWAQPAPAWACRPLTGASAAGTLFRYRACFTFDHGIKTAASVPITNTPSALSSSPYPGDANISWKSPFFDGFETP